MSRSGSRSRKTIDPGDPDGEEMSSGPRNRQPARAQPPRGNVVRGLLFGGAKEENHRPREREDNEDGDGEDSEGSVSDNEREGSDDEREGSDDDEALLTLAKQIMRQKVLRAELVERIQDWLAADAIEGEVVELLRVVPENVRSRCHIHYYATKCFDKMLKDARKSLTDLELELLLSCHFETKWASKDEAAAECERRHIDLEDPITSLCIDERLNIIRQMTLAACKELATRAKSAINFNAKQKRERSNQKLAAAITTLNGKPPLQWAPKLPTLELLERLHANDSECAAHFQGLSGQVGSLFRAVTFARLRDWKNADATDGKNKSPTNDVMAKLAKITGIKGTTADREVALGRLIHRNPVLCFQSVLKGVTGKRGWENGNRWKPGLFEAMLRDNNRMQSRCDALFDQFRHIIFIDGIPAPTLHAIPMYLRAIAGRPNLQCCKVMKSCIDDAQAGDGLFVTTDLPRGATWLYGGAESRDNAMNMFWDQQLLKIGFSKEALKLSVAKKRLPIEIDNGIWAWKANEPAGEQPPNAVILDSPEGVYLSLCEDIRATPDHPVEIYVVYGEDYPRDGYDLTRYDGPNGPKNFKDDWELIVATRNAIGVHGITPSKRYVSNEEDKEKQ